MKKTIVLIFAVITFLFSFFLYERKFDIPLFGGVNSDIRLNFEGGRNLKVYINDIEKEASPKLEFNSYKTYELNNSPVYKIAFSGENIKNAAVAVGHNLFYFDAHKINSFKKDENGCFLLPDYVKYYKNSKYITDKGNLHRFFIDFLSIFYNPFYFLIPLAFFIAFLKMQKINFVKTSSIWWILILGALLRLSDLVPVFWGDEFYTVYMAGNPNLPFLNAFSDPGNPPLFFIIAKYWMKMFGTSEIQTRILPVIFSVVSIYLTFYFAKTFETGSKTALKTGLLASFLMAVNVYSIVSSQEFRVYSLSICFSLLLSIYLFKLIKNGGSKNFIVYGIIAALSFNSHFYLSFVLLSNFILGLILIKSLKGRLKFVFANMTAFLTFLPYLIITGINQGLKNKDFNAFSFPDFNFYTDTTQKFLNRYTFLISVLLLILLILPKIKDKIFEKTDMQLLFYSFYIIISVFLFTYMFSYLHPITKDYYFVIILPYFIFLFAFCVFLPHKSKLIGTAVTILLFVSYFLPNEKFIARERAKFVNFDNYVNYYINDKKFHKEGGTVLIVPHSIEMLPVVFKTIKKEELSLAPFPQKEERIFQILNERPEKTFYVKVEHKIMFRFFKEAAKRYDVSFIRTDKDAVFARIVKKKI